ncbi:MAG: hypothetical protein JW982_08090 [Spirochaetes bacterium]|nr:hypothetical protein [Spirochaetota bacterium]
MKRIFFSIGLLLSFLFISCEQVDLETLLKISSYIPPEVVKLHFAVLNGEEVLEQKTYIKSELNKAYIEIYVSPGKNRTLVLVTENINGFANYYSSKTMDIEAGKEVIANLSMRVAVWSQSPTGTQSVFNQNYTIPHVIYWGSTNIINTKYILIESGPPFNTYYEGYDLSIDFDIVGSNSLYFTVEFYPFGIRTDKMGFSFV